MSLGGGTLDAGRFSARWAEAQALMARRRAEGLAFAQAWRAMNGPKFDRLYGPDPRATTLRPGAPWPGAAGW